ncbi:MAG TPA: hypothetical protein P5525_11170, partial [Candidatus Paceibacterota bacterium]|nr:hypothetical protein [Candidatus Paceibacterota bacterium]
MKLLSLRASARIPEHFQSDPEFGGLEPDERARVRLTIESMRLAADSYSQIGDAVRAFGAAMGW